MRLPDAWVIYRKELRETLRDRRTLAVMILLPLLLYPVMTVVVSEWVLSHEMTRRATASRVRLVGAVDEATAVKAALEAPLDRDAPLAVVVEPGPFTPPPPAAGKRALGDAHAIVEVPSGFRAALAEGRAAELRVYFDAADDDSDQAAQRIQRAVEKLASEEKARRLGARGLDAGFADPIAVREMNLASRAKLGRKEISKMLPFFLILMTLLGSFYPAIDLTAGEKERGTLEPLLATPMSRHAIVFGKFLCVATVSALTALLNVACMVGAGLWIARSAARAAGKGLDLSGLAAAFPWGAAALALVALGGATLLFSGLMMAIASLARSFKEAQNYLTPVHMVFSIPAMVSFLPGTELSYATAVIPVANVTLLLKDVTAGTLSLGPAAVAMAAIAFYAGVAMLLAARIYDSERLLFAPDSPEARRPLRARLIEMLSRPPAGPTVELGPGDALALYAITALLLLWIGAWLQGYGLGGLAASQWVCIGLPVLLLATRRRGGLRGALALELPSLAHTIGSVLIGISAWGVLSYAILPIQEAVFPTPRALQEELARMIMPPGAGLGMILFAAALSPGVCEELLCRGALARSLRGSLGTAGAVVVSALLFGILHMSLYRFLPTFSLGILLAVVAFAARSTVASMIVHALNNGTIVLLQLPTGERVTKWLEAHAFAAAAGFAAVLGAGLFLLVRTNRDVK